MTFSEYLAIGSGGILGALLIWALTKDRRRIAEKRRRFANRQPIQPEDIYNVFYKDSGLDRELVDYYWKETARLLSLDPRLLRPEDTFERELGPIPGKEFEDEIEDLMDFLHLSSRERDIQYTPSELLSLDDLIKTFCI